jgi:hypothetical protein
MKTKRGRRFKNTTFGVFVVNFYFLTFVENQNDMIAETLELIKHHTGLQLELCDYFTGVQKSYHGNYFNVILKDPLFTSLEHTILERFADQYGLIQVEPNGYKRLAIFPKTITNA